MKQKTFFVAALMMAALVSCEKTNKPNENNQDDSNLLTGELTENLTLKANSSYSLSGGYHVKSGATLTIEEGVNIIAKDDNIVDYILIEQGAKIIAQGQKNAPIVMTSERHEHGAWGGIHICGKAPINVQGAAKSEIGDAAYGGNDVNDNSGILRYVRIEYAGYAFSEEKEANGFTLYGVGKGTTMEYLQAYKGSDDGFEWFGGTVNVKYLVSTDNNDDSFDWTQGWTGKGQFMVAHQLTTNCDCLMEADNNSKNFDLTPVSHPILANLTLIGNNSPDHKRGIRLRAGTQVEIYNALVMGKESCITVETKQTETALKNGTSKLDFIHIATNLSSKEGIYTEADFTSNSNNAISQIFKFAGSYIGKVDGGKDMTTIDSNFFTKTNYKGAIASESENWAAGWTR